MCNECHLIVVRTHIDARLYWASKGETGQHTNHESEAKARRILAMASIPMATTKVQVLSGSNNNCIAHHDLKHLPQTSARTWTSARLPRSYVEPTRRSSKVPWSISVRTMASLLVTISRLVVCCEIRVNTQLELGARNFPLSA